MPYRAPGLDDPRQSWLLREINEAQRTLDAAILEAEQLPDSDLSKTKRIVRYNALKREVNNSFSTLDKNVLKWSQRDVPDLYRNGWFVGASQVGAGFDFTLPHREAIDVLSFDAYDDIATRLQKVSDGFSDTVDVQRLYEGLSLEDQVVIQSRTRSAVAQALLTGNADPKKVARGLAQDLWNENPRLKIIDSAGRQWKMETYTRMLVRTKSANAYNAGSLNKYAEEGVRRVQVFDGVLDDEECAAANGSVWSLRYAMNHVIEHPNCRRAFGPKVSGGPVDEDTDIKDAAVVFDRIELTATFLAALRHFRQTGEINVSSTMARVVIEVIESQTIPLPIIDGFLMGLAAQGFRGVNDWVESFIDPVLYHGGLIKHVPARAQIVKASRPQMVLDEVANAVKKASVDAFGMDTNPHVQHILDQLTAASAKLDRGLEIANPFRTGHSGGLKWVGWVADNVIDPTQFGKLTTDTLLRMRDGGAEDVLSAYRASSIALGQFKQLRVLHMTTLTASLEEAQDAYLQVDRMIQFAAQLLADDVLAADAPDWFIEGIRAYGLSVADLRDATRAQKQLADLILDATAVQGDILARINDLIDVHPLSQVRKLAFPTAAGANIPTNATSRWDTGELDDFIESLRDGFSGDPRPPAINTKVMDDFRLILVNINADIRANQKLGIETPLLIALRENIQTGKRSAEFDDLVRKYLGLEVDWDDPDSVINAVMETYDRFTSGGADGFGMRLLTVTDGRIVLDEEEIITFVASMFYMIDREFWGDNIDEIFKIRKLLGRKDVLTRNIPHASMMQLFDAEGVPAKALGQAVGQMYSQMINEFTRVLDVLQGPAVIFSNLERNLENIFDSANVARMAGGIHGSVYLVTSSAGDYIIKPLTHSGHTGSHLSASASVILNSWVAEILGSDVVPYRVVPMNDVGDLLVVSPYLRDLDELGRVGSLMSDLPPDAVRRLSIFHSLVLEGDNNPRNFLYDADSLIRIDHESSYGLLVPHSPVNEPYGINSYPSRIENVILRDRWTEGADELFGTDVPVRLHQITEEELAFILTVSTEELGRLSTRQVIDSLRRVGVKDFPLTHLDNVIEKEFYIPTGRTARFQYSTFTGGASTWTTSHPLTDTELEFVLRIIQDPDGDLLDEIIDVLETGLRGVPDAVFDDAGMEIEDLAERVLLNLEVRASQLVEQGIFDLSGGTVVHTNARGTSFAYGDTIALRRVSGQGRPDDPDIIEGLIVNIWERPDGTTRIGVFHNMGVGKTAGELELDPYGMPYLVIDADRYVDEHGEIVDHISDMIERSVRHEEAVSAIWDVEEVVDVDLIRSRETLVLDDLGLAIGVNKERIILEITAKNDEVIRFVDDTGDVVDIRATDALIHGGALDIFDEEMSRIAPEYRPRAVEIHLNSLEKPDGTPTFGLFDADTGTIHLSVAAANVSDTSEVVEFISRVDRKVLSGNRIPEGVLAADMSTDDIAALLDWDRFREVFRHELSHSVHVGVENRRRVRTTNEVLAQILEEFPDAVSRADLNQAAGRLLPAGVEISEGQDALQALIGVRVAIVEDVVNTNLVWRAEELLDLGTEGDRLLPVWASRAYAAIKRKDPDAHNEFFAEVWARIAAEGGGDDAVRKVANRLGVTEDVLREFLDPKSIDIPDDWSMASPEFFAWVESVLNPNATKMIPIRKSVARELWYDSGQLKVLKHRVFDLAEEEGGGGFTLNVVTGEQETEGLAVAILENQKIIFADSEDELKVLFDDAFNAYEELHQKILRSEEYRFGGWKTFNKKTGKWELYLDTVKVFDDDLDAAQFGFIESQLSMYNLNTLDTIPLGSTYADFEEFLDVLYRGKIPYDELIGRTERVAALKSKFKVNKIEVQKDIEYIKGQKKAPVTMSVFSEKDIARIKRIAEERYSVKVTHESMRENAIKVLERGLEEYTPEELVERFDFYSKWHDDFVALAERWDQPPSLLMAAAAVISPERDAVNNYVVAVILAEMLYRDRKFPADKIHDIKLELLRKYRQYLHEFDKPEDAKKFLDAYEAVKVGSRPSDFDSDVLGYVLNVLIKDKLRGTLSYDGTLYTGVNVGLINHQTYTTTSMNAIQLLRRELSIDEAATGAKVRSFANNLIDPFDVYGNRDLTIDVHMSNLLMFGIAMKGVRPDAQGKVVGIDMGLKGMMADTLRIMYDEGWGDVLGLQSDAQMQEILWGLWREGLEKGWWGDLDKIVIRSDWKGR